MWKIDSGLEASALRRKSIFWRRIHGIERYKISDSVSFWRKFQILMCFRVFGVNKLKKKKNGSHHAVLCPCAASLVCSASWQQWWFFKLCCPACGSVCRIYQIYFWSVIAKNFACKIEEKGLALSWSVNLFWLWRPSSI